MTNVIKIPKFNGSIDKYLNVISKYLSILQLNKEFDRVTKQSYDQTKNPMKDNQCEAVV